MHANFEVSVHSTLREFYSRGKKDTPAYNISPM